MNKLYCANLYCWEPALELNPTRDDFRSQLRQIYRKSPKPKPTEAMLKLTEALLKKYPDTTVTDETVWSDGPLKSGIIGQFINISIKWWGFEEASKFVKSTANGLGLHAYDPQDEKFYPAPNSN